MPNTHVVLREFNGPNGKLKLDRKVDASGWRDRNVQSLVARRYLVPLDVFVAETQSPKDPVTSPTENDNTKTDTDDLVCRVEVGGKECGFKAKNANGMRLHLKAHATK